MQMNLIEANLAQRGSLPLPSAALVIDMRGVDEDDVMDRLRIEIADLASEMKVHDLHHWRYLTDFLSFRSIPPLRTEDVEAIRSQQKPQNAQKAASKVKAPPKTERRGLTGRVDLTNQGAFSPPFQDDQGGLISEGRPFDIFQQRIEELTQEIDRIRNNRIAAVADLNKAGIAGRSVKDATVRVIFLTDAGHRESLFSVATYAAHLRAHFKKLERDGYQAMVSITAVCLDNSAEAGPPTELIQGLRWNNSWEHLDSLLISEKYSDNAALIAGAMQTYLAELLLYVLLLIPPLRVNSSPTTEMGPELLLEDQKGEHHPKGQWVSLPAHTYMVGLAAVEHSARWGRRWLNYGLVTDAVEVLHNRAAEDDLEQKRIKNVVNTWLSDWRAQVAQAIPDRIPGNIQGLKAIPHAINIARPAEEAFTTNRFSLTMGERTIHDLDEYLANVARTYIIPLDERAKLRQEAQIAEPQTATLSPTLQDAVDSIPLIQQRLREWEDKDPALKKGTPLVNAQVEAQRILSHPNFFAGATGAIPRARTQLKELGTAISDFQNHYQNTPIDLMDRRTKLEKRGKTAIDDLKKHIERIPFLATVLRLARPMVWATFILVFCLIFLAFLLGLAWLEHLIFRRFPDSGLLAIMNTALHTNESPIAYVVWGVVVAAILIGLFMFRHTLFDKDRSPWSVEVIFWLVLVICAFSGLLFSFSFAQLADDPGSLTLLSWLSPLPYWSGIIAIIALVILIVEAVWFWQWITHLMREREQIVNDLRDQHRRDIDEVTQFIADTVALQLLLRTGLTDGKGGPGSYYERVDQLYRRLIEVSREAKYQKELAANRLALSLSEIQPGATSSGGAWLNLKIREEWLDVESLTDGYQRLKEQIGKDVEVLKELAELLLRMMGEEAPIEIERLFRERPFTGGREQRHAQVLMATLAALALRFSVAAPSVDSMTPMIERYENIDNQYIHQLPALSTLIQTLRRRVRKTTLQPILSAGNSATGSQILNVTPDLVGENITMGTDGLATWGQMLWERRDRKLDETLVQDGVLPKLLDDGYDSRAVMRRLQARTSLFGRSMLVGQPGEVYLLLAPSIQSRLFRQNLNIPSRFIIDFPDTERLLLLYIQRFVAEALFIPDPEPPATLMVKPDELAFDIAAGVASQAITISNSGSEALNWTATLGTGVPGIVSLSTGSGTNLAGGADTTSNVSVDTTGFTSGSTFTTSITIHAVDVPTGESAIGSPVTIPITINVVPAVMQLSTTNLSFKTTAGSNPALQSIALTNTDSNILAWTAGTPSQGWLTADPPQGSEVPGATSSVNFSVDAMNLAPGTYSATVTITPSVGLPAAVTAVLTVV